MRDRPTFEMASAASRACADGAEGKRGRVRESSAQLLSGRLDVKVRGRSGVFYVGLKHFSTSTYRIKGEYGEIICFLLSVARRRGGPRRCAREEEHLRWEGRAGKKSRWQ